MYKFLRTILFLFDPETAHKIALAGLNGLAKLKMAGVFKKIPEKPVHLMGLDFKNPVGLAAGLDKNAQYLPGLALLGFGFIEVGSVSPKPQPGNPTPRLFRLKEHQALINRMGFNNEGVASVVKRLKKRTYQGILGVSITQNNDTAYENSIEDYITCFQEVYPYADFISVNVSCPNVKIERSFQESQHLAELVRALKTVQTRLHQQTHKYVPFLIKIAPDLDHEHLKVIAKVLQTEKADGVICNNTSRQREGVEFHPLAEQKGGLSGAPLFHKTLQQVQSLRALLGADFPIIAVGGITTDKRALQMFQAGANLIQIYTGLIYQGPKLIREMCSRLAN